MAQIRVRRFPDAPPTVLDELFDSVRDLVFAVDRQTGRILFANAALRELLGWRDAELGALGPWINLMRDDEERDRWRPTLDRIDQLDGASPPPEYLNEAPDMLTLRTSGGSDIPIAAQTIGLNSDRIVWIATPAMQANSAEELVRQTLARFRSIVDSLSICLVLKDRDGRRVYANPAYLELRKHELKDVLGKTDFDLFPEDLAMKYSLDDQRILETGEVIHKFEENVDGQGNRTWTEIIKGPLRDPDGNTTGIQILFWDATDRKRTELELERERYLLHALLDNVPDSIYFKDRESRFVRVSRGMAKKFQLEDPSAIIGKTDADIFTEEHARQAREDELRIMATGQPIVGLVERETWPDRPDTWCSTTKLPLYDSAGRVVGTFGISRDITDMVHAEQQLREARDAADRANRAKSEFLANMSHEIRTPMNGIIGMAELLKHTRLEDDQKSFVEMIEQSAQSLLRIINDILDFSKIEAGKLELEKRAFDLRRCVSHAAKSLAVRAAEKSLELVLEMDPDVPSCVLGDPDRLRQILVNLVGNSIKFTHQGEIAIRVSVAHGPPASPHYTLQFSVRDTGIGIPHAKQKSIFEAFTQADLSTTRQYGGTGLGLSISSQLVAMMGGSIWLESEVGVGTTFFFTIPFEAADLPDDEAAGPGPTMKDFRVLIIDDNTTNRETLSTSLARRGMIVQSAGDIEHAEALYGQLANYDADRCAVIVDHDMPERSGLALLQSLAHRYPDFAPHIVLLTSSTRPPSSDLSDRYRLAAVLQKPALHDEICHALRRAVTRETELATSTSSAAPARQGPPLHFLLAEDGAVNRAVFEGLLARYGHQVTSVEDGAAAVDAWRDFEFDAILMDVQMPQMDGIQATRIIRQQEAETGRHTPIIAITAAAMQGDQERCLEAGMDDYLSKPVDVKQLLELFEKLWQGQYDPNASGSRCGPDPGPSDGPSPAPTADTDARPVADFDAPLRRMRCTPQQHRQLLMTLRDEAQQRLTELSNALDTNDPKLLVRASHSLKSAAAMFRAATVAESSAQIELHARSGDIGGARQEFGLLRQHVNALLRAIDRKLATES